MVFTGFIPWEPPHAELTGDVEAFLDRGDTPCWPPSARARRPTRRQCSAIATALDDLGLRLFLVGGESNMTGALRDRPGVWPFVPLHLVLGRCRAVVHSASLGTTAAVLGAGPHSPARSCSTRSGARTAPRSSGQASCSGASQAHTRRGRAARTDDRLRARARAGRPARRTARASALPTRSRSPSGHEAWRGRRGACTRAILSACPRSDAASCGRRPCRRVVRSWARTRGCGRRARCGDGRRGTGDDRGARTGRSSSATSWNGAAPSVRRARRRVASTARSSWCTRWARACRGGALAVERASRRSTSAACSR